MRRVPVEDGVPIASVVVLLALLAGAALPPAVWAQETAVSSVDDLLRAEVRIREGRIDEARREVERWWISSGGHGSPETLQFALWLRGILTVDPLQADRDFQRIVLEFPSSPHAAPSRLRLGQSAHARGDLVEALKHYEALDRDYPGTRFRLIARSWLERFRGPAQDEARRRGIG